MGDRELHVGDVVVYTDEHYRDHNALVTIVWDNGHPGTGSMPACNLVHVSSDGTKEDPYGRQIERPTSISHVSMQAAPGVCWRFPDEEKPVYREPAER